MPVLYRQTYLPDCDVNNLCTTFALPKDLLTYLIHYNSDDHKKLLYYVVSICFLISIGHRSSLRNYYYSNPILKIVSQLFSFFLFVLLALYCVTPSNKCVTLEVS
jgi:hypothetical protein